MYVELPLSQAASVVPTHWLPEMPELYALLLYTLAVFWIIRGKILFIVRMTVATLLPVDLSTWPVADPVVLPIPHILPGAAWLPVRQGYFLPCCAGVGDYSLLAAGVPLYYSWPGSGARPTPPHTQFCSRADRSRPTTYILPG